MGSLCVKQGQPLLLCTPPLGTALAVALYDPVAAVGGLLAAILPDSTLDEGRALDEPALFVDSGLQSLLNEFTRLGGQPANARIHAAGGMDVIGAETVYDLGIRNRQMLLNLLSVYELSLTSSQLGGYLSVSLSLDLETGEVSIKRPRASSFGTPCKK